MAQEARQAVHKPGPRTARFRSDKFIIFLCVFVERTGGKVTLNERENRGTLIELLECLRPHLPSGFIPSRAPNKLRRLREKARHLSAKSR
jgi:hypothetical protein